MDDDVPCTRASEPPYLRHPLYPHYISYARVLTYALLHYGNVA